MASTEILMPSYYVPLTGWGRLCIKAKLLRLIGILPHSVITDCCGCARSLVQPRSFHEPV